MPASLRFSVALRFSVVLLASACTRPNPAYCNDDTTCADGLVCNVAIHTCVTPTEPDASTSCASNEECPDPAAPVCDQTQSCRACELDDECTSGVCRDDGRCEDAANVLYASPTGISAGQCPTSSPCDISYALTLVTTSRKTMRLTSGMFTLAGAVVISPPLDNLVVVGGRSAVIARSSTGPSFDIRNGGHLELRGITITRGLECGGFGLLDIRRVAFNSPGSEVRAWVYSQNCRTTLEECELTDSKAHGIDANGTLLSVVGTTITKCQGSGIKVGSIDLMVDRCEINENQNIGIEANASQNAVIRRSRLHTNRMGGVSAIGTATYELTNNFIYYNGDDQLVSTFGGLKLDSTATHRVEHNTFVYNTRAYSTNPPVYAGGFYCTGPGSNANNIIAWNKHGNEDLPGANTNGTCDFTGSQISNEPFTFHFVAAITLPADYHLADALGVAVNAGVMTATPATDDFDGDPRSDGMPDVGADEFAP